MSDKKDRKDFLGQIRNPLVFFALALLLIEGIIGLVVGTSRMTGEQQFYCVLIMAFLYLVVVIVVAWITIKWPKHLYEEIVHEIESNKYIREFIESKGFQDVIEDLLISKINPDCLIQKEDGKKESSR